MLSHTLTHRGQEHKQPCTEDLNSPLDYHMKERSGLCVHTRGQVEEITPRMQAREEMSSELYNVTDPCQEGPRWLVALNFVFGIYNLEWKVDVPPALREPA